MLYIWGWDHEKHITSNQIRWTGYNRDGISCAHIHIYCTAIGPLHLPVHVHINDTISLIHIYWKSTDQYQMGYEKVKNSDYTMLKVSMPDMSTNSLCL